MRITFPVDYADRSCYLVAINASLIPLVAGALRFYEKRGCWISDSDYEQGYYAFAELQACMMQLCLDQLIESNDRLYRMLGTAIYGTTYVVDSTDPLIVSPAIDPTHTLTIESDESILGRMDLHKQLLENALNGTDTPNYSDTPGIRELLANLITAVEAGTAEDTDILAELEAIAVLLA